MECGRTVFVIEDDHNQKRKKHKGWIECKQGPELKGKRLDKGRVPEEGQNRKLTSDMPATK